MDSVGVLNIQTSIICNMHIFRCLMYNGVKKYYFVIYYMIIIIYAVLFNTQKKVS